MMGMALAGLTGGRLVARCARIPSGASSRLTADSPRLTAEQLKDAIALALADGRRCTMR